MLLNPESKTFFWRSSWCGGARMLMVLQPEQLHGDTEGAELLRHPSEPGSEDRAPTAKEVQARQRVGHDLRAAARQRGDGEPQLEVRGGGRNRGQDNVWVPRGHAAHEAEVVPHEEGFPAGRLGHASQADRHARIGVVAQVGRYYTVTHPTCSSPPTVIGGVTGYSMRPSRTR